RQLPLYDTPYEPAENGGDSDPERSRCPRESRLPQDDERPPEEYDQPWEWKKERISKAFAVEFNGGRWRVTPSRKFVSELKAREPRVEPSLAERIDPSMPLESQFLFKYPSYRKEFEFKLSCCYKSSSEATTLEQNAPLFCARGHMSSQGFMHMKLSRTKENKYILGQNSCPFDSVPEIIHFYSSCKLPIKGAEHMSLLYPVAIRTL
uniref:Src homology 2 domain containing F n=1 Tax=Tetraodon nigroviridis TaxID=99883 RepID=H3BWP2_TETNG